MKAIEKAAELKVIAEIERAAERMVEEGAAALAEGRSFEFDTASSFAGSSTSKYFFKPSTTFDEPVVTTVVPGLPETPPPAMASAPPAQLEDSKKSEILSSSPQLSTSSTSNSIPPKPHTPPLDFRAQELAAERKVIDEVEFNAENIVEAGASALAEGKELPLSNASFTGSTSKYFSAPSRSEEVSVVTTVTPTPFASVPNTKTIQSPPTIAPEPRDYQPFSPLPSVESSNSGYLWKRRQGKLS